MKTALAIDIGGTKISAALVKDTTVTNHHKVESLKNTSIQNFSNLLKNLIERYNINDFDYVAIATTGIVSNGILTALNPYNLGGIANMPLIDIIKNIIDKPTGALNDAQAASYAEFLHATNDDFCFITVSTGVGGGIILNKKLLTGKNGIAGHVGHTIINQTGDLCSCNRIGCVETIASGTAIAKRTNNIFNSKEVFEQFYNGEPKATAIINDSAKAIAQAILNIILSFDISEFAIGGSVGLAPQYIELIKQHFQAPKCIGDIIIRPAVFSHNAGLVGATKWFHKEFFN